MLQKKKREINTEKEVKNDRRAAGVFLRNVED